MDLECLINQIQEEPRQKGDNMARICEKWFPIGSFPYQKKPGFYMDDVLKDNIDIYIKNAPYDWDFTIIITGGGEVRVGKSVLAMQIACYWAYQMKEVHNKEVKFDLKTNFIFEGSKLIEQGNYLGKNYQFSPLVFDEAGADLEGKKIMQTSTQDVLDYYRECGQYNLFNILVIPDFFDLPAGIALTRSNLLIDVYYLVNEDDIFERGYYNVYSKPNKKDLYIDGKKYKNYKIGKIDFPGNFDNVYPLNEKEYRELKAEALKRRGTKAKKRVEKQRNAAWYLLWDRFKMTQEQIAKDIEELAGVYTTKSTIEMAMRQISLEN